MKRDEFQFIEVIHIPSERKQLDTYVVITDKKDAYLFEVDEEDGYRSSLHIKTINRMDTIFQTRYWTKRYENIEYHTVDGRYYSKYTFLSNGKKCFEAYFEFEDDYYPYAVIEIPEMEEERELALIPKEVTYTFEKLDDIQLIRTNPVAYVVSGDPKLGKTTFMQNYFNHYFVDTDSKEAKDALSAIAVNNTQTFGVVIGKYRNTHVLLNGERYSFKDAVTCMLKENGYTVYGIEFHSREGSDLSKNYYYKVINEASIDLKKYFSGFPKREKDSVITFTIKKG